MRGANEGPAGCEGAGQVDAVGRAKSEGVTGVMLNRDLSAAEVHCLSPLVHSPQPTLLIYRICREEMCSADNRDCTRRCNNSL
jgi:hypothetical protein